ncbi:hypothetical protein GVN15_16825 [Pseudomonas putida]|nr:hypothetical protein [Pseudomonas putida]
MEEHFMYARFWRCALQVNPFSYHAAYRGADLAIDEAAYNQALLEQCRETGVNVIGVADHGSVAAVDALRQALTPHGIVVFPGFEIAASDKTHFVCLFDENTSVQSLERYLGNLDLLDPEERILPSRLGSIQLINKIEELGGFIYAAHCTQDSGLLKHRLQHVWKHPALRAAQIPHSVEALEGEDGDFYRRVLLGRDAAYQRERPMALINAKDVAKPEDLGKANATCLIKMTRPTFSAFKVAFLDPESRIRLNSTQVKSPIGRLLSLTVTGGARKAAHTMATGAATAIAGTHAHQKPCDHKQPGGRTEMYRGHRRERSPHKWRRDDAQQKPQFLASPFSGALQQRAEQTADTGNAPVRHHEQPDGQAY